MLTFSRNAQQLHIQQYRETERIPPLAFLQTHVSVLVAVDHISSTAGCGLILVLVREQVKTICTRLFVLVPKDSTLVYQDNRTRSMDNQTQLMNVAKCSGSVFDVPLPVV